MSSYRRLVGRSLGALAIVLVLLPVPVIAQPSVEQAQSISLVTRVITSAAITRRWRVLRVRARVRRGDDATSP